jgi:hypothetical protein
MLSLLNFYTVESILEYSSKRVSADRLELDRML